MSCSQTHQLRNARREIKKLDRSSTTTFVTPLLCPKLPQDSGPILSPKPEEFECPSVFLIPPLPPRSRTARLPSRVCSSRVSSSSVMWER